MRNKKFILTSIIIALVLISDSISYADSNLRRDPFDPQVRGKQRNERRIILDKTYVIRPKKEGYPGSTYDRIRDLSYDVIDEDKYRGFDIAAIYTMDFDNQLAIWVCKDFMISILINGGSRHITGRISDIEFDKKQTINGSFDLQDREYSISVRCLNARYIKGRFFDSFRIRIIVRRK